MRRRGQNDLPQHQTRQESGEAARTVFVLLRRGDTGQQQTESHHEGPAHRESSSCHRSNASITQALCTLRSRSTLVTAVVCLEPAFGVSVCDTRQLTRARAASTDSTLTLSIVTSSSRISLNAFFSVSTSIEGCSFLTASAFKLSSAAEYCCSRSFASASRRSDA